MPPSDEEFDAWLRSLLKRLDLRWAAYRKKRKTVRKRMDSRARRIGLNSWREYARYLDDHPREWTRLSEVLAITVSRFFRDPPLFEHLAREVFPRIAEMGSGRLVAWSAGCASGQEAYTLAVLWEAFCSPRPGAPRLEILGTDVDAASLKRAGNAAFLKSEIEWVPASLRELHFHKEDNVYRLRPETASRARFFRHDLLRDPYPDEVHLLLCRWSAFFYFGDSLQMRVLSKFSESLVDGGFLVIGKHETLPVGWSQDFDPAEGRKDVFIRKPRGRPRAGATGRRPGANLPVGAAPCGRPLGHRQRKKGGAKRPPRRSEQSPSPDLRSAQCPLRSGLIPNNHRPVGEAVYSA